VRLRRRSVRRGAVAPLRRTRRRPVVAAARRSAAVDRYTGDPDRFSRRREIRRRGWKRGTCRRRRRADHLRARVGPAAGVEYPAGAGDAVRGGVAAGARRVSRGGRELAEGARRQVVKRGWWLALGAAALVALLVGGRWLAWESAARALA